MPQAGARVSRIPEKFERARSSKNEKVGRDEPAMKIPIPTQAMLRKLYSDAAKRPRSTQGSVELVVSSRYG